MNYKQAILNIFERKKPEIIPFQPRLYYWHDVNLKRKKLKDKFKEKNLIDIYRQLNISPRYCAEVLKLEPIKIVPNLEKIKINIKQENNLTKTIYSTPLGELVEIKTKSEDGEERITEFLCKKVDDLKILEYIIKNISFYFDEEIYKRCEDEFGELGVPQIILPWRSPLQLLFLNFMGIEETIYALYDEKEKIEEFMKVCEEKDLELYELVECSPIKIINLGENLDSQIVSPSFFEKYLVSYYNQRCQKLHKAGKFVHIHIDGRLRGFLPFLSKLEFDGYEALTPYPQGDVEIEEIKSSIGDKILLDGIPAIMFLPNYDEEELLAFASRVAKLFYPRLILGVSDELPPDAPVERIEMIQKILHYNSGIAAVVYGSKNDTAKR